MLFYIEEHKNKMVFEILQKILVSFNIPISF